ncbi:MAG: hypothetical protein JOZ18_16970, partial [Chloroflexi bacterium]|nr:hypothetical protein [Chloroflexota bacterium]
MKDLDRSGTWLVVVVLYKRFRLASDKDGLHLCQNIFGFAKGKLKLLDGEMV